MLIHLVDTFIGTIPGATNTSPLTAVNTYNTGSGMSTAVGEALGALTYANGSVANNEFPQMAFSIEKVTVTAKTRALKAEYTMELAQEPASTHRSPAPTWRQNRRSPWTGRYLDCWPRSAASPRSRPAPRCSCSRGRRRAIATPASLSSDSPSAWP